MAVFLNWLWSLAQLWISSHEFKMRCYAQCTWCRRHACTPMEVYNREVQSRGAVDATLTVSLSICGEVVG